MKAQRPFEVMDAAGKVHRINASDGLEASQRIADLHQVVVTAWRYSKRAEDNLLIGVHTQD